MLNDDCCTYYGAGSTDCDRNEWPPTTARFTWIPQTFKCAPVVIPYPQIFDWIDHSSVVTWRRITSDLNWAADERAVRRICDKIWLNWCASMGYGQLVFPAIEIWTSGRVRSFNGATGSGGEPKVTQYWVGMRKNDRVSMLQVVLLLPVRCHRVANKGCSLSPLVARFLLFSFMAYTWCSHNRTCC